MTEYEATQRVQRVESLEAQFNISIEGLLVTVDGPEDDGRCWVTLFYELTSTGEGLPSNIKMTFVAYSEEGQVVGLATDNVYSESFLGVLPISTYLKCKKTPSRFRLYPSDLGR
jgi:hypothetical protein